LTAPAVLSELYKVTGRPEQALSLLSFPAFANSALQASAYAAAGRRNEALAIIEKVQQHPAPADLLPIAMVYFHLGDDERGFRWLERAVEKRLGYMPFLNVHPAFDRWRNDPRFAALVRRLRLPDTIS